MTVTLMSLEQDASSVTHTAAQVMSPIREQNDPRGEGDSSDQAPLNEDEDQGSTNGEQVGDTNLAREEAERFGRRLGEMPGGIELLTLLVEDSHRRLVNNRRTYVRDNNRSVQNPPVPNQQPAAAARAPPPRPPPSEPSDTSESNASSSAGQPDDDVQSTVPSHGTMMLDNRFGPRYDDAELVKHTEKMLGKEVPLPNLKDKKIDFDRWKSELTLRFPTYKLDEITYGPERYDSELDVRNRKYHTWYDTRRTMAFTAMALYMNLRELFKVDKLREQMEAPSLLWSRIVVHITSGDGVNPDYILRDLLNLELQQGETVDAYVSASEELVRRLRQANSKLEECEHASLLISNSQHVFRELAEQHTVWCSKNDRKTLTRSEATRRLRQAELARRQVAGLQPSTPAPRAAQVSLVQGLRRNVKKRAGSSAKDLSQKNACTKCGNCGRQGHWYAECTATTGVPLKPELVEKLKAKGKRPATSLVNAVRVVEAVRVVQAVPSADTPYESPVYSPTTPACSPEDKSLAATSAVPTSPQRLQLREIDAAHQLQGDECVDVRGDVRPQGRTPASYPLRHYQERELLETIA